MEQSVFYLKYTDNDVKRLTEICTEGFSQIFALLPTGSVRAKRAWLAVWAQPYLEFKGFEAKARLMLIAKLQKEIWMVS